MCVPVYLYRPLAATTVDLVCIVARSSAIGCRASLWRGPPLCALVRAAPTTPLPARTELSRAGCSLRTSGRTARLLR